MPFDADTDLATAEVALVTAPSLRVGAGFTF